MRLAHLITQCHLFASLVFLPAAPLFVARVERQRAEAKRLKEEEQARRVSKKSHSQIVSREVGARDDHQGVPPVVEVEAQ